MFAHPKVTVALELLWMCTSKKKIRECINHVGSGWWTYLWNWGFSSDGLNQTIWFDNFITKNVTSTSVGWLCLLLWLGRGQKLWCSQLFWVVLHDVSTELLHLDTEEMANVTGVALWVGTNSLLAINCSKVCMLHHRS